jgi:hypothetical protein
MVTLFKFNETCLLAVLLCPGMTMYTDFILQGHSVFLDSPTASNTLTLCVDGVCVSLLLCCAHTATFGLNTFGTFVCYICVASHSCILSNICTVKMRLLSHRCRNSLQVCVHSKISPGYWQSLNEGL